MWSKNYQFFHELLKDTMKEPQLTLKPIELPQSRFDSELYKKEGEHSWFGSVIKIDLLLGSLDEAARASQSYILFTDVDIVVKPGIYESLKPYMDDRYDMVFLKEGSTLNIGFLLLRVCDETIFFWKDIRKAMVANPGHDQKYVNQEIQSFKGIYTTFDEQVFTCSNTWNKHTDFKVLQCLCSNISKEFNMAEKIFSAAQITDVQPYMEYVSDTTKEHIYKFQNMIYHSYQEAKMAVR